ncbi:MAG TPA: hypothetical protein VGK20_07240 [Candidatus Binatia bacterium]|jgi:hypothetical protein
MTIAFARTVAVACLALAVSASPSFAQAASPSFPQGEAAPGGAPQGATPSHDCSRWPASTYDDASGTCVCPQGMWWNLRGDACLPREHAAGEFCTTVWPGSQPFFFGAGGYRCICAPPTVWDSQATACRQPITTGSDEDCQRQWPGTMPVLSPSGADSECRCPGGRRWDEVSRGCVPGAPVVASRGYFAEGYPTAAPGGPGGQPQAAMPGAVGQAPGVAGQATGVPDQPPGGYPGGATLPRGGGPASPPPPAAAAGQAPPPSPECESLLAEIRGRAAAGQTDQADALGMRAAVAGCDPAAISDASRTKPAQR